MSDVIRVFVEKREGFDVEARAMLADLRDNLGLKEIRELRLLNRYDVEGLSPEDFTRVRGIVFSEPNVDDVYDETFVLSEGWRMFAMEYLPGQYDQRADSAAQCVQLLTQGEYPRVVTARVVLPVRQDVRCGIRAGAALSDQPGGIASGVAGQARACRHVGGASGKRQAG